MIGRTISHYKILSKLGEGGMGVVYKAEDTKLHRFVALKFLPPHARDEKTMKRFVHEAQAISALEHPHICAIYEIDETPEGQMFIVMPCYEGEALEAKIKRGPLDIDKTIDIAIQVASGLAKAHEKGVVHRDIKPGNILVTTDGLAKIVDFGVAKLETHTRLTRTGSALGTPMYMSPEQVRGGEVDRRSDMWSLGVVLYEMVTGRLPFDAGHEPAVMYAIMNEEPAPVTSLRAGVPMELGRIINKCLAKSPDERYQHGDDLVADLRSLASGATGGAQRDAKVPSGREPLRALRTRRLWIVTSVAVAAVVASAYFVFSVKREPTMPAETAPVAQLDEFVWQDSIAVLPLRDFSPQRDQEYFCEGMTEDIITRLSGIRDFKVISRTSTARYKDTNKSIGQIGKELGVGAILEGSIQKEGRRIRVNVQLIRTADDAHIWADKYDRNLESVFAIQDEISGAIVNALRLQLTSREKRGVFEHPIDNVAAYECYLKASNEIYRFSESSLDSARTYLQRGLDIVGDNALLYSAMADAYWQYVNIGAGQEDDIAKAEEYARKALALDPESPKANTVIGTIYKDFLGEQSEAIRHYQRALAANPKEPDALRRLSYAYVVITGNPSAALPLIQRAQAIDPLAPWNDLIYGILYSYNGQHQLAVEQCRKYYQSDPANPLAQFFYAWTLARNEQRDEAFAVIDRAAKATPDNVCTKFGVLLKHALLKDEAKALAEMTPAFEKTCRRDPEWSYTVGMTLALLGAGSEALDWVENAVNLGFINYPALEKESYLDNVRGEDRFKKLMERVSHEWERFEVGE